jgi:hypothetical protein
VVDEKASEASVLCLGRYGEHSEIAVVGVLAEEYTGEDGALVVVAQAEDQRGIFRRDFSREVFG